VVIRKKRQSELQRRDRRSHKEETKGVTKKRQRGALGETEGVTKGVTGRDRRSHKEETN
jgi:hypothetical protein